MDAALDICRFLHFSAAMLLFGGSTFNGMLVPAGLRNGMPTYVGRVMPLLALVIVITTVLWLGLEAGEAGEGWPDTVNIDVIWSVLTATAFGRVWAWRLVLAGLVLGALLLPP